jgi:hypothetical protein
LVASNATAVGLTDFGLIIGHEDILLLLTEITIVCYARSILFMAQAHAVNQLSWVSLFSVEEF